MKNFFGWIITGGLAAFMSVFFILCVLSLVSAFGACIIYAIWNYAVVLAFPASVKALTFFQCWAISLVATFLLPKGGR
jgi:hypothetical protein